MNTTDFSFSDNTPQSFRSVGSDTQSHRSLVDMCDRNSLSSTFQRERQRGGRDDEESFFSKPIEFSDPYQKAHFVKQLEHLDRTVHNLLNKYRGDDNDKDRTIYPPGHPKNVEDDYDNHKGHDHHKHKGGNHDRDRPHKKPDPDHPQCHSPDIDKPKPESPKPTPEQPPIPKPEQPTPQPEQPDPTPERPPVVDKPDETADPENPVTKTKLIIPFPRSQGQWNEIIENAPQGSLIFPTFTPGADYKDPATGKIDPTLPENIRKAVAAGLKPIGYVTTTGGTKDISEVKREIDNWYNAADVQGIYLGASGKPDGSGYAEDPQSEAYFNEIAKYIHSKGGIAAINGVYGKSPSGANPDYIKTFDVQGTFEGSLSDFDKNRNKPTWELDYSADKFAAFVSDVGPNDLVRIEDILEKENKGYIYITDLDYGANPTYFKKEIDSLD